MSQNKDIKIPSQQKYSQPQPSNQNSIVVQQVEQFSGPLPSPKVLEQYKQIYPGLEKIIVDMAQKQSEHRIKMESTVIPSREKQSLRGQWFAFVIALLLILLSGYGFFLGYQVAATIISGGTLTAVVALFLTGKMGQSKQRSEQSKTAE